jgi:hypothetical protein
MMGLYDYKESREVSFSILNDYYKPPQVWRTMIEQYNPLHLDQYDLVAMCDEYFLPSGGPSPSIIRLSRALADLDKLGFYVGVKSTNSRNIFTVLDSMKALRDSAM